MPTKAQIQKEYNQHKKPAAIHAQTASLLAAISKINLSHIENNNIYIETSAKLGNLKKALQTSIAPRSTAFFLQNIWIEHHSNQAGLNKSGSCTGLLLLWYKKLSAQRNLMDCLTDQNPQTDIDEISDLQKTCGKQIFNLELAKKNFNETELESFKEAENIRKKYLNAACVDCVQISPHHHPQQMLKNYFNELETQNRECVGLHTISYISKDFESDNTVPGHIIGWTAIDDAYLLFDANKGELCFDDYQSLITYFFEHYCTSSDYYFSIEDFYSTDDLRAIASLNTQLTSATAKLVQNTPQKNEEWIEMDVYKTSQASVRKL